MAEFLDQHLFHPLGINTPQWEQTADGLTCGGMGLSLPPLALLKIGELLLNQGTYQRKSVISAEYVKAATSGQIVKPSSRPYSGNRYGYQFHVSRHGCFRLDGAFGQVCLIYPEQQMVLVVLSQQTQTERLLELVEHYLVAQQPFLGEKQQPQVLHELATLSSADFIDKLVGQIVQMEPNSLAEGFALSKTNRGIKLHLIRRTNETLIECCPNEWTQGKAWFIKDTREYLQRYKCWATLDENKLEMTVYWIETPYITRISISLGISELIFDFKINVSFTLGSFCEHIKMEG